MKKLILVIYTISLNIFGYLILLSGCSSIMTHVCPQQGYYSGIKADTKILKDSDTGWIIKPLAMIDLPFSVLFDTILLPYDYFQADNIASQHSPKERVQDWENDHAPNANHQKPTTK
ncbi:MAG: YceK/YidQ family lipoprotein [Candidatus Phlomobacter fragariae]